MVGDWPELTVARRESLREVRRLAATVKHPLWPRSSCLNCRGHGMCLIDAEIDPDFQPLQTLPQDWHATGDPARAVTADYLVADPLSFVALLVARRCG